MLSILIEARATPQKFTLRNECRKCPSTNERKFELIRTFETAYVNSAN